MNQLIQRQKIQKRLIQAIRNNEKVHYLLDFPTLERNEIVLAVTEEFKKDVRMFDKVVSWKEIKRFDKKIKIIIETDKIINKFYLGNTFKNLFNDGTIYIFFSKNKINDGLKEDWAKFVRTLDEGSRHGYTTGPIPVIIDKEEAIKNYRKTAAVISNILFITLIFAYVTAKSVARKNIDNFELLLLTFSTFDFINLFLGYHIHGLLKKKFEPLISRRLKKWRSPVSLRNRYFSGSNRGFKEFREDIRADKEQGGE